MKAPQTKKKDKLVDPFDVFEKAVSEAFGFLVTDYNFKFISKSVQIPECLIKYRNTTTGINIIYEWGGQMWVDMTRLEHKSTGIVENESYSVSLLVREFNSNMDFSVFDGLGKDPTEYVKKAAYEYANYLKEYGHSILLGDFQLFTKLKKQAEIVLRERNKEMFGSETGESIR